MSLNSLLIIYCVVNAFVLCGMLYFVRGRHLLKVLVVAVTFFVSSAIYFSFDSYKGWPVDGIEKERARLLAVVIDEPNKDDPGGIYVWVVKNHRWMLNVATMLNPELALRYDGGNQPRAHRLPYTEGDAQGFRKAEEALREGMYVEIYGDPSGNQGTDGNGDADGSHGDPEYELGPINPYAIQIEDPRNVLRKDP